MSTIYEVREVTLPANGTVEVEAVGAYVNCLSADAPFNIEFGANGKGSRFEQGLTVETAGFHRFRLWETSGAENKVVLALSAHGVRDSRLNIQAGLNVQVDNFPDQLVSLGSSYVNINAVTNTTLLIDPVANANGAVVRTLTAGATSGQVSGVFSGTVAPVDYSSTTVPALLRTRDYALAMTNISLPAGHGLWFASSSSGYCAVTFDLL